MDARWPASGQRLGRMIGAGSGMGGVEASAPTRREAALEAENARLRRLLAAAGVDLAEAAARAVTTETRHAGALKESGERTAAAEAGAAAGRVREDRLQAILDSATDYAIVTTDLAGAVTGWNVGAERIFGWPEAEALGRPAAMIFTPEDRAANAPAREMATALATGRASDERWHLRRNGERFWGQGALTVLPDGQGFLKVLRDRTATRRMQERLRESEEFNRRVLQSSADCIKVLDLDARLEFMSEGGMCVMEVDDFGSIAGARWPDFWTGEEHAKALAAIEAARQGGVGRFQGPAPTLKGSPRWWDVVVTAISGPDGRPEKLLSVSRDVTATEIGEAALRKSEARLKFLSEMDESLRACRDAPAAMLRAAELLGQRLGVSRCAYADVDSDHDRFVIRADYTAPGIASSAGIYSLDLFGAPAAEKMRGGRTLVIRDVPAELAPGEGVGMFRAIGIEAIICCPLVKEGRLTAMMAVHQDRPRDWREDEIALVETAVEHCWAYVERVGAEARLRESEAKFQAIANSVDQMIWSTRPDGYHDYYNDRWYDYTGVPYGSTDGEAWNGMFHPDDQERAWAAWRRSLATGEPYHIEYRLRHRSGQYRWVLGRAQCVRDERGEIARWYGTCTDIDDLKVAEARLRESEERLRLATEAAEVGFWDVDPNNDVLVWPPRVKAMFGISPDAPVTMRDFYEGLHPKDRDATGAAYAAAADPERRSLYDVEYRTIGKEDRVVRWVAAKGRGVFDADGRCIRVVGTAIDVTERKRIEERLRELNETLEARVREAITERDRAWSNARDLLLVIGRDGVIRAVNPAWEATLGWPAEDLVGRSYLDFVEPEDHGPSDGALATAAREPLPSFENRHRHRDGSLRHISWVAAPEGELIYASGRDVSADKARETELAAAQEQLRQSQKMEAVGQLTGGLAHDFNNLLAGISGSLDLMSTRLKQGRLGELDRYIVAAQGAARRAAALTHRLLAFSRRQALDPRPTDVNRLVSGMEELVRRTVGPSVTVEVVAAAGLWPALVDAGQLENALLNLCLNARDAMPDGGRITIETANKWLDGPAARERELEPGQYLSLCVTDTGTGMTPEVMAKAFDPFFTTKPLGQGTGLGLSMIYGFARQSGGQVRIYSEAGRGTTMCLYLPRHYGAAEDAGIAPEAVRPPRSGQGETVLIVDDEPTVRMLVAEVLEDLGYTALEAADGQAGLRILRSEARIDLLITDVGLPGGMNGRQMAEAGRAVRPGLKVLFITGYAENATLGNGHLEPGMQLLTKPFAMQALAARVRDMLRPG